MAPGSVLTHAPVAKVEQNKDVTLVWTKNGQKFRAKKVIVAIPTNTYKDISFSPALPCQKQDIVNQTKPGIYGKIILTYSAAWWGSLLPAPAPSHSAGISRMSLFHSTAWPYLWLEMPPTNGVPYRRKIERQR